MKESVTALSDLVLEEFEAIKLRFSEQLTRVQKDTAANTEKAKRIDSKLEEQVSFLKELTKGIREEQLAMRPQLQSVETLKDDCEKTKLKLHSLITDNRIMNTRVVDDLQENEKRIEDLAKDKVSMVTLEELVHRQERLQREIKNV